MSKSCQRRMRSIRKVVGLVGRCYHLLLLLLRCSLRMRGQDRLQVRMARQWMMLAGPLLVAGEDGTWYLCPVAEPSTGKIGPLTEDASRRRSWQPVRKCLQTRQWWMRAWPRLCYRWIWWVQLWRTRQRPRLLPRLQHLGWVGDWGCNR